MIICPHTCSSCHVNLRFAHQPLQQNPIMHGLGHMGGQGVHPGLRPNQMLAEQQQQQQQAAQQQQQQQYLRQQQALRVRHLMSEFNRKKKLSEPSVALQIQPFADFLTWKKDRNAHINHLLT